MKRLLLLLIHLLPLAAMTQEEDPARLAYEAFRQKAQSEFAMSRREANAAYAAFLKQAWATYKAGPVMELPKLDEIPPRIMPEEERQRKKDPHTTPFNEVIPPPTPRKQPAPFEHILEEDVPGEHTLSLSFFGTTVNVRLPQASVLSGLPDTEAESLAEKWKVLSQHGLNNTLSDVLTLRDSLALPDWGYLLLLDSLCTQALPIDEFTTAHAADRTLLQAFLFCQSGYAMRLGTRGDTLVMLYGTQHIIYGHRYFDIDGLHYYPSQGETNHLRICQGTFPGQQPLSLLLPKAPLLTLHESAPRNLKSQRYADFAITTRSDLNLLSLQATYPPSEVADNFLTRWAMVAEAPMRPSLCQSIYPRIRSCIAGLSPLEATQRLLNWVQTAFPYEYDSKIWGYDRTFFPEETLYYPYCDCEDRSILFTRLVRDLIGLPCLLVYYPGHLATAVAFPTEVQGDFLTLNGRRYTICNPTYIGAPIGRTMPDMDNLTAKVIRLTESQ